MILKRSVSSKPPAVVAPGSQRREVFGPACSLQFEKTPDVMFADLRLCEAIQDTCGEAELTAQGGLAAATLDPAPSLPLALHGAGKGNGIGTGSCSCSRSRSGPGCFS